MSQVVPWLRANATWLQSLFVAGLALMTDFGVKLTQAQESDLIAFVALALGAGAHFASKGQNT